MSAVALAKAEADPPTNRRRVLSLIAMAQLIVRNLDDEVVSRLRRRAAARGRSMEAEHREILREALLASPRRPSLKEHLIAMPDVGTDRDFERPREGRRTAVKL